MAARRKRPAVKRKRAAAPRRAGPKAKQRAEPKKIDAGLARVEQALTAYARQDARGQRGLDRRVREALRRFATVGAQAIARLREQLEAGPSQSHFSKRFRFLFGRKVELSIGTQRPPSR